MSPELLARLLDMARIGKSLVRESNPCDYGVVVHLRNFEAFQRILADVEHEVSLLTLVGMPEEDTRECPLDDSGRPA